MYKKIYKNMCFLSILTLILTSVIILSACGTTVLSKFRDELINETVLFANVLNTSDDPYEILKKLTINNTEKEIVLLSENFKVKYIAGTNTLYPDGDLSGDISDVHDAKKTGIGFSGKYSVLSTKNIYNCTVKLNDSSYIRVSTSTKTLFSFVSTILLVILFLLVTIYIFTIIIARRLTYNIVKPIENVYAFDNDSLNGVYEEIKPFINRIMLQNKEIKRQMEKVKNQKTRLQAITDNMNEGLIIIDDKTNILTMNNCSIDIFNINQFNYKYKKISEITDNIILLQAVDKALEGKKNDIVIILAQKTFQIFLRPVKNDKKTTGVIMLLFDVTAKADSEHLRREFTANVSHELKTPLTSIHGYAQIISGGIAKPEDIVGFAEKIEKESSRLIVLIDDIIKLSKLDENVISDNKEEIHVKPIILQVCEMLGSNAKNKNINIEIIGKDFTIIAYPSQISEMIYNLCDNAIKYNVQNGSIKITLMEKRIIIADTGIGIPEKYIDRIYERFFRVDKSHSKKVNGTGLGLSIVKHIAQINNAQIYVKSKPKEGTIFTIIFSDDDLTK